MIKQKAKVVTDKVKSSLVSATGALLRQAKGPDELLGELLADVQSKQIYPDGKTFVDLVPKKRARWIHDTYRVLRQDPEFDLKEFVARHFYDLSETVHSKGFTIDESLSIDGHIHELWAHLEYRNRVTRGSLIALPYPYIVPGGRFKEQFYWDSYFIMLGLQAEGNYDAIESMIKNFAYMIRKFGYIPTANRTYLLSRSQPPLFASMLKILQKKKGNAVLIEYLPYLLAEYRFWMKGRTKLAKTEHRAFARLVELPGGVLLNRYYDNKITPRPESLREDIETAVHSSGRPSDRLFLHLRAAAESGWDFSSRWFENPNDIRTIHTADILPIDLNCLLYELESTIEQAYRIIKQPILAKRFSALAKKRQQYIDRYLWDDNDQFYVDYNFHHQKPTGVLSLAAVFPLFVGIASETQARAVAGKLKRDFLKPGGLVTTLKQTGQQWDSPNGWAPLQWIAIQGLRRYGHDELADEIKRRWLDLNDRVFHEKHKLIEKYNVTGNDGLGGGGEYPLQDGFGWTNGVYAALMNEDT